MYFQDNFQKPNPFQPDVAVNIDDVWDKKVSMQDAHTSQMYEWLPWVAGNLDSVPKDPAARKTWLAEHRSGRQPSGTVLKALEKWYGAQAGCHPALRSLRGLRVRQAPNEADLRALFPFFPAQ